MYTPKAFEVTDLPMLHAAMKQSELATLVTNTAHGLVATHLPLMLDETRGEYGTLTGHVSRANMQWRESDPEAERQRGDDDSDWNQERQDVRRWSGDSGRRPPQDE